MRCCSCLARPERKTCGDRSLARRSNGPGGTLRSVSLRNALRRFMTNSPMRRATLSCLLPPADDSPWAPPLDSCDVVVRLETAGITDAVAQHEYGYRDAWGLAEACFRWLRTFPTSD